MIPKIIHYCWFGRGQMSDLELYCLESWKRILPDFQIKKWDEDSFDFEVYSFARDAYNLKKFAFVSDVCRLFALYQDGGIYLDTDMLVLRDLSPLLYDPFFIGEEKDGVINAAIIGSEKGSEKVKSLLVGYQNISFDFDKPLDIPTYLALNLNRSKIKIYPKDFFYALPFKKRGENFFPFLTLNSFTVHLWNYSWRNEWSYLHEKEFRKSWTLFLKSIKIRGLLKKDFNFLMAFAKFWLVDRFPQLYGILKKNQDR